MTGPKKVWTCPNCTEEVEDHFEVCWNCETSRKGMPPPVRTSEADAIDKEQRAFLNEKFRSKRCVQCNVVLTYRGRKEFHEGINLGVLGDFAELFVDRTKLEMYVCTKCLRIEFFLSEPPH
jgi:hypothetical protein